MGLFSSIFGKRADFAQLVKDGAVILDVRTPGEYAGGHIKGSKNIPLQSIQQNLSKIPKDKVIIMVGYHISYAIVIGKNSLPT